MGLFDTNSKTVRHETNISKRTTKTDSDVETVSGVKTEGDVTQAGGSVGLTGERFANVANNLSRQLGQGVNAIAAGAQTATRQARDASQNAAQVSTAASRSRGRSSAGDGSTDWVVWALVGVGVLAAVGAGSGVLAALRR